MVKTVKAGIVQDKWYSFTDAPEPQHLIRNTTNNGLHLVHFARIKQKGDVRNVK